MKVGDLKQSTVSRLERHLKGKVRGRSPFSSKAVYLLLCCLYFKSSVLAPRSDALNNKPAAVTSTKNSRLLGSLESRRLLKARCI